MQPDYKNWIPKGMVEGAFFCCALCLVLSCVFWRLQLLAGIVLLLSSLCAGWTGWKLFGMYRAFDFHGKRSVSRNIIEAVASQVDLPDGGVGLDVGCGSGALTIACAKRNPQARMVGVDIWAKAYSSFSQQLCERNAKAEGVENVSFQLGNALNLDFPTEHFDVVTSNYVYHNIPGRNRQTILLETLRVLRKGGLFVIHDVFTTQKYGDMNAFIALLNQMGYKEARLVPTDDGLFLPKKEAARLGVQGSALLVGRK
ncbi:MAG: class I SAM-dependent methyltransferase [Sphaerochaetaceae bacterium]|nr:class I SAM-dependent methyltransferase [Spirochaetales bacterium]MDY5500197.1 class I SAM-dependent methyltransferase [Sphaerochaetaceae bacterium]